MKHFIFSELIGLGALAFLAGCGDMKQKQAIIIKHT